MPLLSLEKSYHVDDIWRFLGFGRHRPAPGEEVLQEVERCKAGGGIIGSMTPQICTKSVENVKLFEK